MRALSDEERRHKLDEFAEDGGHPSVGAMLEASITDSVSLGDLHRARLRSHDRNGAGSGRRLLRSTVSENSTTHPETFTGGKVVMTDGIAALRAGDLARLLERVRRFDEFTKDNDPCGEHDFGSLDLSGRTYFFKVDYYAPDMEGGSEDPADPTKTTRVLTIMRADEY